MKNKDKEEDYFLKNIGEVRPLKNSEKNFKKINLKKKDLSKKISKIPITNLSNTLEKKDISVTKKDLKIETTTYSKKFKRGKMRINKKVDLHGCSLEEAKTIFFSTIEECYYSNNRNILFVTGKGIKKEEGGVSPKLFYGKIRKNFQTWVNETSSASKILHVRPASPAHGGDGAFYVYLRKIKN